MKAPFPWFGGKSKVAKLIWSRLGDVPNLVEPFAGSLAVLLARPHWPWETTHVETVNDMNGWLCNFWRALALAPDATAEAADWPVSELDLHSRGDALFYPEHHAAGERLYAPYGGLDGFIARLRADPGFHDAKLAGWWVWGQSLWIGDNWGRVAHNAKKRDGVPVGVVSALPHLGDAGRGVNRKSQGNGCDDRRASLTAYFRELADRLRGVRVCCGDWARVLGPCVTTGLGTTGVFLDPPYDLAGRDRVYGAEETDCWSEVCEWCAANGDNPKMRVALCGYDGGWTAPAGWDCVAWKAHGGYSSQAKNGDNSNRHRERIWFSPACVQPRQTELFTSA